MSHWSNALPADTCDEARKWCLTQPDYQAAWDACERGDWLLWLAGRLGVDRRLLVRAACACARLALQHEPGARPQVCSFLDSAERHTTGGEPSAKVLEAFHAAAIGPPSVAWYAAEPIGIVLGLARNPMSDGVRYWDVSSVAHYAADWASTAAGLAVYQSAARSEENTARGMLARARTQSECARLVRSIIPRPTLEGLVST